MTATAENVTDWWSRAACKSADPDVFFPISGSGPALAQVDSAKAVCAACQVRGDCLRYALAAGTLQGVWGGMTEEERRLLRQREAKARLRAAERSGRAARAQRPRQPSRGAWAARGCLEPANPES
jgi:WhiB family transcriptional regulator, redox-sensing transcriptional regulator